MHPKWHDLLSISSRSLHVFYSVHFHSKTALSGNNGFIKGISRKSDTIEDSLRTWLSLMLQELYFCSPAICFSVKSMLVRVFISVFSPKACLAQNRTQGVYLTPCREVRCAELTLYPELNAYFINHITNSANAKSTRVACRTRPSEF